MHAEIALFNIIWRLQHVLFHHLLDGVLPIADRALSHLPSHVCRKMSVEDHHRKKSANKSRTCRENLKDAGATPPTTKQRVYYSLAVWQLKPILSAGLQFRSHLSGGLRLRNYRAVVGNHKFSSWFSVSACFCAGYSNRVKRLRRLSGNFNLLKAPLFNKGLPFRTTPSQSGLPSVSPAMWGGVGR